MKLYHPLLFGLLLTASFGCQKEIQNLQASDEALKMTQERLAFHEFRNYSSEGQSFYYTIQTYGPRTELKNDFMLAILVRLNQSQFDTDWEELYELYSAYLENSPGLNPLEFNPAHSHQLQFIAYELGHRAALRNAKGVSNEGVVEHFMDVLIAQKGIDCDAMAEIALALQPTVTDKKFSSYSRYILKTAETELADTRDALQELKNEMDNKKVEETEQYQFAAEVKRKYDRMLGAEKAMSLLASSK